MGDLGVHKEVQMRKDQGGKHGGQKGMPKPAASRAPDQGIVRDERGQEQPGEKERAQKVSRLDKSDDPRARSYGTSPRSRFRSPANPGAFNAHNRRTIVPRTPFTLFELCVAKPGSPF